MRGNFFVEYPSGNTYEGGIYGDGKRNGTGHFTWTSGIEYTGDWLDGNQHGYGVKTWGPGSRWAGDRYEGEFRNNVRTGQGAYYWHNGDVYRGGYKDDSQHGFGVLTWASGEWLEYKGEWSGGKFNGYGRLSYKDQSVYIGFWKDSNREGEGLKMWINGVSFYGRMRNDSYFHGMIMNGDTSFIFSPFQNSASHGKGFKVANATHGNVDCIQYDQANEAARSCHRLPDEVKQIFYSNFDFYEGDVITRRGQEKSDGFGEFKADNGSYYIGEWKDGAQDGFGLMRDPVERTLVGTFSNGVLNGAGASLSYSTKFRTIHFGGKTYVAKSWVELDSF